MIIKISIIINPSSYIHSIVKFDNGIINIITHDTTMRIPIFNSIYLNRKINSRNININNLNNLKLQKINLKKYPHVRILKQIPNKNSLFETVIVSVNDELVDLYLRDKKNLMIFQNYFLKLFLKKNIKI